MSASKVFHALAASFSPTISTSSMGGERPVWFVLRHLRRHALAHAVILLSVFAAVGCGVGSQYAVKNLVDVLTRGEQDAVLSAFVVLTGLIAADNMLWRAGGWVAARSFVAVTGDIRRDLFQYLLGHAPAYFADRRPGMLAGRVSATGQAIYKIESSITWHALPPAIAVSLAIALLATVDPLMGVVLVGICLVLGAVLVRIAASGNGLHHAYAVEAAAVEGELVDVVSNAPLVRAFAALGRETQRFTDGMHQEMGARTRSLRYLEKLRLLHASVVAVLTAVLLGWALMLWVHGRATAGDVVLVTTLGFTILHATRDMAVALVDLTQDFARLDEAIAALLVPQELRDATDALALKAPRGRVEFAHVQFAYSGRGPVLTDFRLSIEPGSRVGLVGPSGSGKSTVLALLQRMRDPDAGRVLIDDLDVQQLTQESLAGAIAVVSQDVMLFHRSVIENVRYGNPAASDKEVYAAIEAAGCLGFVRELPQGLDTIVGDRGVKLSGGQRQRLAIARAFLCDAPILVLDEATSALDSASEQQVQEALGRLMRGRTVIAVAHRLSTLRDFDRIVLLDAGRIVQDGRPQDLAHRPGAYRDLLGRQALQPSLQAA
jgi:ATP-binding cassette subfamily B protein